MEEFFNQTWCAEFADPLALQGDDKRLAQKTIHKLMTHHAAPLFNEPVDLDVITDYLAVVDLMIFTQISEKLGLEDIFT